MKLSRDERKRIFAGDYSPLVRKDSPDAKAGEMVILSWTRGGAQFLIRDHDDRKKAVEAGQPILTEVPRKPTLWIKLRKPRFRDGKWLIEFSIHDQRQPVRMLGAGSPALEDDEWTEDTERGYVSGGPTVDKREAVDDEALREFAIDGRARFAKFRNEQAAEDQRKRQERAARSELAETMASLDPEARIALLAEIQRACKMAKAAA